MGPRAFGKKCPFCLKPLSILSPLHTSQCIVKHPLRRSPGKRRRARASTSQQIQVVDTAAKMPQPDPPPSAPLPAPAPTVTHDGNRLGAVPVVSVQQPSIQSPGPPAQPAAAKVIVHGSGQRDTGSIAPTHSSNAGLVDVAQMERIRNTMDDASLISLSKTDHGRMVLSQMIQ